jgi:hypothetical protein
MKVLVTGGREYKGRKFLSDELWKIHEATPITTLIHGGARGADRLAGDWGRNRKTIEVISVPADWNRYGKKAGALRNQLMLDEHQPELVLAFPGGTGTADMVRRARAHNIPVIQPEEDFF